MSGSNAGSKAGGSRSNQRPLNNALMVALLVITALAPLPFGSARPLFWAIWASVIGLVALAYGAALMLGRHRWRTPPGDLLPATTLFILGLAYIGVQLMPLGAFPIETDGGVQFTTPQISVAPGMTILSLLKQVAYGLFAFLFIQCAVNDDRRRQAAYVLLFVVLGYALYGIISLQSGDTILGLKKWAYLGSATSTFINRNSFATFLGIGAMIALAQGCALIVRQSERHRNDGRIRNLASNLLLHFLGYLFLLAVVVATGSRMGLIATITGTVVIVALTLATTRKMAQVKWLLPVFVMAVGTALFLYGGELVDRIGNDQLSISNRILIYQQALDLVQLRPLTGFGAGSFEQAFQLVHQLPLSPEYAWSRAHNTYLTLWTELGLIFGSLPLLAMGYFGWKMLRSIGRYSRGWSAQAAGIGALTVAAVHSLADFSLEIPAVTLLFLALVAMGVSACTTSE